MSAPRESHNPNPAPVPRAYLSRRYRLSAAHRLHADAYTDQQNRAVYGKCNNPHGHGHNYIVEVTVGGPVDPQTGMVCNLGDLDAFAHTHLLDRFDRTNLNTLAAFRNVVPTTENLTLEIYRIFAAFPAAGLTRVSVQETSNNSFEYSGQPEKV
jgi:6-pyruvoyltetrahydropterin/6-carboxytetrahydropterin synthase